MKKDYVIPVSWEVYSTITVSANSMEEALKFAKENIAVIPLCADNEYVDGSYLIDEEQIRSLNGEELREIGEVHFDIDEGVTTHKDMVKITCYYTTEEMERKEAIEKYGLAMSCSEGSEQERYATVMAGLLSGLTEVDDGCN